MYATDDFAQSAEFTSFASMHSDVAAWLVEKRKTFDFAASLLNSVLKFGRLTDGQLGAAERCVARSKSAVEAPTVNTDKLHECFNKALEAGLKKPKLRFDGFQASLAPVTGRNAGAIYIKNNADYLGKIQNGKFFAVHGVDPTVINTVSEAITDPLAAAVTYGRRSGSCSCCGRELTVGKSIELGIGPICAEKFGM